MDVDLNVNYFPGQNEKKASRSAIKQKTMKAPLSYTLTLCCLFAFSCEDDGTNPDYGFIRATINGVETVYKTLPAEADYYNYIRPGAIEIRFNKNATSSQYFSISIIHGDVARDVKHLSLPFVIKGPNPDFNGNSPEVLALIIDPDGAPYGKQVAAGSSFNHDFTLTITSVDNNTIKGTFSGTGHGEFENGEFSARLPLKEW